MNEAINTLQCAYINFLNMVRIMPAMHTQSLFPLVNTQLTSAIAIMDSKNGRAFCEHQYVMLQNDLTRIQQEIVRNG